MTRTAEDLQVIRIFESTSGQQLRKLKEINEKLYEAVIAAHLAGYYLGRKMELGDWEKLK